MLISLKQTFISLALSLFVIFSANAYVFGIKVWQRHEKDGTVKSIIGLNDIHKQNENDNDQIKIIIEQCKKHNAPLIIEELDLSREDEKLRELHNILRAENETFLGKLKNAAQQSINLNLADWRGAHHFITLSLITALADYLLEKDPRAINFLKGKILSVFKPEEIETRFTIAETINNFKTKKEQLTTYLNSKFHSKKLSDLVITALNDAENKLNHIVTTLNNIISTTESKKPITLNTDLIGFLFFIHEQDQLFYKQLKTDLRLYAYPLLDAGILVAIDCYLNKYDHIIVCAGKDHIDNIGIMLEQINFKENKKLLIGNGFDIIPANELKIYLEKSLGLEKKEEIEFKTSEEKRRGTFEMPLPEEKEIETKTEKYSEKEKTIPHDIAQYLSETDLLLGTLERLFNRLTKNKSIVAHDMIAAWENLLENTDHKLITLDRRFKPDSPENYINDYETIFKNNFQFSPEITNENVLEKLANVAWMKPWHYYYDRLKKNIISLDDYEAINSLISYGLHLNRDNKDAKKYFQKLDEIFKNRFSAEEFIAYIHGDLDKLFTKNSLAHNKIRNLIDKLTTIKNLLNIYKKQLNK